MCRRDILEISLENVHPWLQELYRTTDYLKITSPDMRLRKRADSLKRTYFEIKSEAWECKKTIESCSEKIVKNEQDITDCRIIMDERAVLVEASKTKIMMSALLTASMVLSIPIFSITPVAFFLKPAVS